MAKKVISYKLNADGSIPDFVESGGYFAKDANDTPNMVCIGVSKDDADTSGAVEVFATAADATVYISSYTPDCVFVDLDGTEKNLIVADMVAELFASAV